MKAFGGEAFRAVYTVNFADRVYVLHAFQKKSKRGIATSREDNEMVRQRLMRAREMYADWLQQHGGDDG